jgi:hypothetical protein
MKFKCTVIAINDEELGCQVTFSEKKDLGKETTLYNRDPDNIERKIFNSINNLLENGTNVNLSVLPKSGVSTIYTNASIAS